MIVALLLALFQAAPATQPASRPASPGADVSPALFLVSDEDTELYVFGSMHALPDGVDWRSDKFDAVFADAEAVYFEIPMTPATLLGMQVKLMQVGMLPQGETLRDLLDDDEDAALEAMAARAGLPMAAVDRMKPSTAATSLAAAAMADADLVPTSGVELVLAAEAAQRQLEVGGLETIDEQIDLLFNMPEEEGLAMLRETLATADEPEAAANELRELYAAWSTGDTDALHAMMEEMKEESPDLYQRLLVDRNANWVPQLVDLLAERPGVVLIVVGGGHLEGEGGVLPMLREKGVSVERVE